MKDFTFRLRISFWIVCFNIAAVRSKSSRKYVVCWIRNGFRDLWYNELDDWFCCTGWHCGCYGATWRTYWEDSIRYHKEH